MALDALVDWEKSWQLSVSPSKCCVLCIYVGKDSSALVSPGLSIGDIQLPVVCSTLDLGVTITSDLTPCMHVKNIVAKPICVQMQFTVVLFPKTGRPFCVRFLFMLDRC